MVVAVVYAVDVFVSPAVAARLDPDTRYGVWWFNQRRVQIRQVSEPSHNGRHYRVESRTTMKPKEDWVAVPVPEAGIPREVVDAARAAIRDNRRPSSAGRRFWELSGGIIRCGVCGNGMQSRHYLKKGKYQYGYYRCRKYHQHGDAGCDHRKSHRADKIEAAVWEFVSGLLRDPERMREGLDEMIEQERAAMRGDPDQQAKAWLEKLADVSRKQARFQDMAAEGLISFDELRGKLLELDERRKTVDRELEALRDRWERIEQLGRDRDTLMDYYASMMPEALDELTGEERHQAYRMLRLEVYVLPSGSLDIRGAVGDEFCISESTPIRCRTNAELPGLRFRALLTGGASEIELALT